MTLSAELASGACGIRWRPPAGAELVKDETVSVRWRDGTGVTFDVQCSLMPFALDAGTELDPVLRADVEAGARAAFIDAWEDRAAEAAWEAGSLEAASKRRATDEPAAPRRPRTDDPAWSPLVEVRPVALTGGRALAVIRRLTYEPGHELVAGDVIVPVAVGHVRISVRALGTVPEHPLSLVRRHVDAITGAGAIAVTAPAAPPPSGEVILEEAGCAITPPPRFLPVQPGALPVAPTCSLLARIAVGWTRRLDVWRTDRTITARDRAARLAAVAARTIADLKREGLVGIRAETRAIEDLGGRPQVEQVVDDRGGASRFTCHRWFVDHDGVVFRISALGDGDPDEVRAELAAAVRTWRRLDPVAAAPPRPWWKLW